MVVSPSAGGAPRVVCSTSALYTDHPPTRAWRQVLSVHCTASASSARTVASNSSSDSAVGRLSSAPPPEPPTRPRLRVAAVPAGGTRPVLTPPRLPARTRQAVFHVKRR